MTILGVRGVVQSIGEARGPSLGSVSLEIGGGAPVTVEGGQRFEIEADGTRIQIDASGIAAGSLELEERSKKGAWAEVERDPLAGPFLDKAPGPHIRVSLKGAALLPGDIAYILGEVSETEPVEASGSMRTAPDFRPSAIRAIAVASGPGADRFIERIKGERVPAAARPSSSSPSSSWRSIFTGAVVIALVALIVGAAISSRAARVELWMLALAAGALVARFNLSLPRFQGREARPALGYWDFYYLFAVIAVPGSLILFFVTAAGAWNGGDGSNIATAVVLALAAVVIVLPLETWSTTRQFGRIARLLLETPAGGGQDGAWSSVAGVVSDPTPIRWAGADAAIGRTVEADKEPSITVNSTFMIDAGRELVAVDPAEACWATLVTRTIRIEETVGESTSTSRSATEDWIPIGASIIAAGRVRRSEGAPRMTSTGPESLLLFATEPKKDARSELEALVRSRRSALFVLIAIAAFAAASALSFEGSALRSLARSGEAASEQSRDYVL